MIKEIVVATRNKKKLQEIKDIMRGTGLKFLSLDDFPDAPYVKENGRTFLENAEKKARAIAKFTGRITLGEDSGLCIDALGGAPGVYSARFAGKDKSDLKNNQKALKLLAGLSVSKRKAHYVCVIALADSQGKIVKRVEGRCGGHIGFEMKGSCGFGYDPVFVIPKFKKTFAELGEAVKHKMSHRYKALKKLRFCLTQNLH